MIRSKNYKIIGRMLAIALFILAGCSKDIDSSTTKNENVASVEEGNKTPIRLYRPEDGTFSHDLRYMQFKSETKEEAIAKGKTILTLADAIGDYGIVAYIVRAFNRDNDYYHVEMEIMDSISRQEEQTRLKMDLASGKGPDLMTSSAVPDAVRIMTSGCFVEMSDFLEKIGVSNENCFPAVKSLTVGEKVYGISLEAYCSGNFSMYASVMAMRPAEDMMK